MRACRARPGPGSIHAVVVLLVVLLGAAPSAEAQEEDEPTDDGRPLTELTLEELMNVQVTLPSRRPEARSLASAAVYVITAEDIRRSGVTNIPDALRLAPGVQVAEATASQWAVGVRGLASRLARSLLVLMDGRSLYTPLFAGTYWETQNTFLEDIDRIEVVRGPGGALWGANAFNGVINIVTKGARETQGLLATGGGGTEERGFGRVRYGGRIGDDVHYRFYGLYFDRASFPDPSGPDVDDWRLGQGGFRFDWDASPDDLVTVQGDLYDGEIGQLTPIISYEPPFASSTDRPVDVSGGNVLGRWSRVLTPTSDLVLQMYWDHTFRRDPTFTEERDTFELDFQHRFTLPWRQEILWGIEYRLSADSTHGLPTVQFDPADRTLHLISGFVQDDVWLVPGHLRLSIGTRFESTTYTDFDYQPSGSLLWTPATEHVVWGSISRAVRTPSRIERDLRLSLPPVNLETPENVACLPNGARCVYPQLQGSSDFEPETLLSYQVGYRIQPLRTVFFDVAAFYTEYDDLRTLSIRDPVPEDTPPLPHTIVPLVLTNDLHGHSYGVEVSVTALPASWWRLTGVYSYLQLDLRDDAGSTDVSGAAASDAESPHHQVTVQSSFDLPWDAELDGVFRYVDTIAVGGQRISAYATFDVRLAKQIAGQLELALVGQNLAQAGHRETFPGADVPRGMYGQVRWRF